MSRLPFSPSLLLPLFLTLAPFTLRAQTSLPPTPPPQDRVAAIGVAPLKAPLNADFSPGSAFTLEGWVFLETSSRSAWLMGQGLGAGGVDPHLSHALLLDGTNGNRLQFAASTGAPGSLRSITAPASLPLHTWTHVAAIFENNALRLVINGSVVASGLAVGAPPTLPPVPFSLGIAFTPDGRTNFGPFPGYLRQARFWRVARTPAQLLAAAAESLPTDRAGLVAAWPLDENGGPVARDLGDGNRSLTVVSAFAQPWLSSVRTAFLSTSPFFAAPVISPSTGLTVLDQSLLFDIDADGDADLVHLQLSPSLSIPETRAALRLSRNDRGTFTDVTAAALGDVTMVRPSDYVVGDFNGDGRPDLLIAGFGLDTPPFPGEQLKLLIATADGRLRDESLPRLPPRLTVTHGVSAADIDGDGDLDIYLGRSVARGAAPHFYLNNGSGTFTDAADRLPAEFAAGSAGDLDSLLVDVNGDRFPDLVLGGLTGPNELLLNDGRGRFARHPRHSLPPKLGAPDWLTTDIASADFDGDGLADLALATTGGTLLLGDGRTISGYGIPGLQILLNHPDGRFRDVTATSGITWTDDDLWVNRTEIVDLNRDGRPDLLAQISSRRGFTARLFLNLGPGHPTLFHDVTDVLPSLSRRGNRSYLATDADGDGITDLILTGPQSTSFARALVPLATGRLANLSVRTQAGTGDATLIAGFALGGGTSSTATKPLLVRAIGPTLSVFGVTGTLADPVVEIAPLGAAKIAENDNWSGTAALKNAFASTGAFPLAPDTSRDAALLFSPTSGAYTATVSGGTGIALLEVYDAGTGNSPRLTNVSARTNAGTGADALIVGFVVNGTLPKKLLIRAAGPTLAVFGVDNTLADPALTLRPLGSEGIVAANDDWAGTAALKGAFTSVGAFPFPSNNSRDAALVIELPPGAYTATISGKQNTTGVALVEVYELP